MMKFKVGKEYLTRAGVMATYLGPNTTWNGDHEYLHKFEVVGHGVISTTADGLYWGSYTICPLDIVGEYTRTAAVTTEKNVTVNLTRNGSSPYTPDRRDYFAAAALQGILTGMKGGTTLAVNVYTNWAAQCADALINELDKEQV